MSYEVWGDGDENDGYMTDEAAAEMVREATEELTAQVGDLAILLSRLAHCLKKTNPDSELSAKALDYLARKNLLSTPLRT